MRGRDTGNNSNASKQIRVARFILLRGSLVCGPGLVRTSLAASPARLDAHTVLMLADNTFPLVNGWL